jgi:hypothetical protein
MAPLQMIPSSATGCAIPYLIEPSKTHMFNHDAIMQLISQQIEAKPPT